jgi:hypothetical protein
MSSTENSIQVVERMVQENWGITVEASIRLAQWKKL